jgi:multiple sugar transport system substrate-binding protein
MEEITLSIMDRGPEMHGAIRNALAQFEMQYRAKVNLHILPWTAARQELVKFGLYGNGPDVSEIGTTWVSDLISMNTLRMFTPHEVDQCRGNDDFLPALLECTHLAGETDTWAIPWMAETVLLHYRKDLFQRAGVDPVQGLSSLPQITLTAQKLAAAGVHIPFALPVKENTAIFVQNIASWVWRAGGDFINRDGKAVLFDQPEFIAGVRAYCDLFKTLSSDGRNWVSQFNQWEQVHFHDAALAMGGMWVSRPAVDNPDTLAARNLAVMRLPGISFVGGSNLVIWHKTRKPRTAVDLVNFLSTSPSTIAFARQIGFLPARVRAINSTEIRETPHYTYLVDAVKTGRSFPAIKLWGVIEERLGSALGSIFSKIVTNPESDLDELITTTLSQTARAINRTLAG